MEVTKGTWQFAKRFQEEEHTDKMLDILERCANDIITRVSFQVEDKTAWFYNVEVKDDSHYLFILDKCNNDVIYLPEFSIKLERWISLDKQPIDGMMYYYNYEDAYEAAKKEYLQRKRWKIFFDKYPEMNENVMIKFHYYEPKFDECRLFEELQNTTHTIFFRSAVTLWLEDTFMMDIEDYERLRKEDDIDIIKEIIKKYISIDMAKKITDYLIYNFNIVGD